MADRDSTIGPMGFEPQSGQQPARPQNPLANYQFSSEEMRVLRECNTESFFQRSLPLGTTFGLGAYFGVKRGFFSPNAKYGAVPKVVVGVIIGYFMGKFSYQQKCAEKIMQLPNSKLGQLLRQRKRGGIYSVIAPDQNLNPGFGLPFTTPNPDIYSDEHLKNNKKGDALDMDTERPTQSGLDDTMRPTLDSPAQSFGASANPEQVKPSVSYEELRKKNREEYSKKSQSVFNRPLPPEGPSVVRSYERSGEDSQPEPPKQKNRYGDVWT